MNWQEAVEKTVAGLGYDLVDCERSPAGLLRVYIDKLPEEALAGALINVEDCERVTRQLQYLLEVENCAYERLEVSSPGLDRPLKKAFDYQRFVGEEIEITLRMPFQGRKRYRGLLSALDVAAAAVEPVAPAAPAEVAPAPAWRVVFNDGKADQALDFSLEEVREARLVPVVNFKGRGAKPADGKKPSKAKAAKTDDKVDGGPDQ
ncbi:ribosome maturation factor RimP [Paucibacter oligotrophus]|uniref:Ribosome maturation factor RimP n=1 Tax=Roseateles oligotrophus TaxID=1769250 RepID=A0A840L7K7_9BURK|nr:ribosome maturation factor RimP [Roseateles oligotrophus]MBB4844170.1 ribosome maturation factor RimP [Roseateles oligotrophus]